MHSIVCRERFLPPCDASLNLGAKTKCGKQQMRGTDVGELGKSTQKDLRLKGWKRDGTVFFLCLLTAFLFADQNISMSSREGLVPQTVTLTLNKHQQSTSSTINNQQSTIFSAVASQRKPDSSTQWHPTSHKLERILASLQRKGIKSWAARFRLLFS